MSYDSEGGSTFGGRVGDGGKTDDTSAVDGDGLRSGGNGLATGVGGSDTFTSPPFRGNLRRSVGGDHGDGEMHTPYNFADVVEQQYFRERGESHDFIAAQHQPFHFANAGRSPRGGTGTGTESGAADMLVRVRIPKKRPRPSYTSDDEVQPTRPFGASPGTKRALSEMMANNLLRLNVSPTAVLGDSGSGAHAIMSSDGGGLVSENGGGLGSVGGWHYTAHVQSGSDAALTLGGSSTPPSSGAADGVDSRGEGGCIGWHISPRSKLPSDAWGLPPAGCSGRSTHGSVLQEPPTLLPFGLMPAGAPASGGYAALTSGGDQSTMGPTQGRDASTSVIPMSIAAGVDICSPDNPHHRRTRGTTSAPGGGGVEFDTPDERQLTTPAKSAVGGKFSPSGGTGDMEAPIQQSPTTPGGGAGVGAQDMFILQPQQPLVLPELLLRRKSALSQQLSGSLPVGLPVLGTLNTTSSNFLVNTGGATGETSTMMPSSPSADMSPRSDLRRQAILKRASMHASGLSPSRRNGSTFNSSATSPTSPSSLRLLMLAAPTTVGIAHNSNKTMDQHLDMGNVNNDRREHPADDMDTQPIVG